MLQLLLVVLLALAARKLLAPSAGFAREFASLLQKPVCGRTSLRALLNGAEYVGGEHERRPVVLTIHKLGYLTLAVATKATQSWCGSPPKLEGGVSTPRMREALDALIGRHHLKLELEGGWLRATWRPIGLFVFPGRFDAERWRDVLAHLEQLAAQLEPVENERFGAAPGAGSLRPGCPIA